MNDKGEIMYSETELEAQKAGFKWPLNSEESETLFKLPESERLHTLVFLNYHKIVLKSRKLDSIEKVKIKQAIKFAVEFLVERNGREAT